MRWKRKEKSTYGCSNYIFDTDHSVINNDWIAKASCVKNEDVLVERCGVRVLDIDGIDAGAVEDVLEWVVSDGSETNLREAKEVGEVS